MGELNTQKRRERRRIIHDMTEEQARKELAELRLNLFNLRLQSARGEVKNYCQFAQTRKDIASILHKLHMAKLEAQYGHSALEDERDLESAEDAETAGGDEEEAKV